VQKPNQTWKNYTGALIKLGSGHKAMSRI